MIKFNVKTTLDVAGIKARHKNAYEKAQHALDEQVIKDSNFYAPQDRGGLQDSALISSTLGEGLIMWATPYARRLYYNPEYNFSTDRNPNAGGLWFETAKAAKLPAWLALAKKTYGGEFNK